MWQASSCICSPGQCPPRCAKRPCLGFPSWPCLHDFAKNSRLPFAVFWALQRLPEPLNHLEQALFLRPRPLQPHELTLKLLPRPLQLLVQPLILRPGSRPSQVLVQPLFLSPLQVAPSPRNVVPAQHDSPGARTRVRASILPGRTKKSPFVLHRVSGCCFFIILPLPQRPRKTFTRTLTLSGSFFGHLMGRWCRNRFAHSRVLCFVLRRAFSRSAKKRRFSLPSFSGLCCGQPSRVFYICRPSIFVFFDLRDLYFPSPARETSWCTPTTSNCVFFVLLSTIVDLLCSRPSLFVNPCLTLRCVLPIDVKYIFLRRSILVRQMCCVRGCSAMSSRSNSQRSSKTLRG